MLLILEVEGGMLWMEAAEETELVLKELRGRVKGVESDFWTGRTGVDVTLASFSVGVGAVGAGATGFCSSRAAATWGTGAATCFGADTALATAGMPLGAGLV